MKIRTILFLLTWLFSIAFGFSQNHTYFYSKENGVTRLSDDSTSIILSKRVTLEDRIVQRTIQLNGVVYTLQEQETKAGKLEAIIDPDKKRIATIYKGSTNHLDILLADGSTLKWKSLGRDTWLYTRDGKEIIKTSYIKEDGKKKLVVKYLNSQVPPVAAEISSIEQGLSKIKSFNPLVPIAAVGVVVVFVSVFAHGAGSGSH